MDSRNDDAVTTGEGSILIEIVSQWEPVTDEARNRVRKPRRPQGYPSATPPNEQDTESNSRE